MNSASFNVEWMGALLRYFLELDVLFFGVSLIGARSSEFGIGNGA